MMACSATCVQAQLAFYRFYWPSARSVLLMLSHHDVQEQRKAEAAAVADKQAAEIAGRATYILHELTPRVASQAKSNAARDALAGKADETAAAKWEEAKAKAADAARAKAEADKAAAEDQRAAAAAAAEGDDAAAEPEVDIEAAVTAATEAVEKPEAVAVTDEDVLNALLEAEPGLKDTIVTSLALQALGQDAWMHDERFAGELDAPADA
jgi:hypothetical protein